MDEFYGIDEAFSKNPVHAFEQQILLVDKARRIGARRGNFKANPHFLVFAVFPGAAAANGGGNGPACKFGPCDFRPLRDNASQQDIFPAKGFLCHGRQGMGEGAKGHAGIIHLVGGFGNRVDFSCRIFLAPLWWKQDNRLMDDMRSRVLNWYDGNRRALPWRALPGARMDPYRVWLSEVMLQQTTVAAVIPYFLKFTEKWPDVNALAAASLDDVLREWAGLGYYARARNLHRCAQRLTDVHDGVFPADKAALQALPGIGDYTAGAIAAIAFDRPAAAMDGNIERVLARVFDISEPLPGAKKPLRALAKTIFEGDTYRPGDFVQGLMDLGATVCMPRTPKCTVCPLAQGCEGLKNGAPESLPRRAPKPEKPSRYGHVYWITDGQGRVLTQKRADRGLLGGMMGLPTSAWEAEIPGHPAFAKENPLISEGKILHTFTHFHLTLFGHRIEVGNTIIPMEGFSWVAEQDCAAAMPSVFRKAVQLFKAR